MITEEEIEKAARDITSSISNDACRLIARECFKEGVKWTSKRIPDNPWHSIKDIPEDNTDIVYVDEKSQFWSYENYLSSNFDDSFGVGWEAAVRNMDITKWAYKEDLG